MLDTCPCLAVGTRCSRRRSSAERSTSKSLSVSPSLRSLAANEAAIDEADARGMTALMHAAHRGHAGFIRALLDRAQQQLLTRYLRQAADAAVAQEEEAQEAVAQEEAAAVAEVQLHGYILQCDANGSSALAIACREARTGAAVAVLGALSDAPRRRSELLALADLGGATALAHACCACAEAALIDALLDAGADPLGGRQGCTPLQYALRRGRSLDEASAPAVRMLRRVTRPGSTLLERRRAASIASDCAALARAYMCGLTAASELVTLLLGLPGLRDTIEPMHGYSALAICARDVCTLWAANPGRAIAPCFLC